MKNILLNELDIAEGFIYFIKDKEIENMGIAGKPLISPIPIIKGIFENNRLYLQYTNESNRNFLEIFDKNKFYDYLKNVHDITVKEAGSEITGLLLKNI